MSTSINIYRPSMCDPLGPDISLVNNSIDLKISYWLTLINYLHKNIDKLIDDRFNPIDKLSC